MANLDQICDYLADNVIIETTTNGAWHYRKWADGTADAWYFSSFSTQSYAFTTSQQSGKFYTNADWVNKQFNLPTGLFIKQPAVAVTILNNGYLSYEVVGIDNDGSTFTVRAWSLYSQTYTITAASIYAIGKWK